MNDSLLGLTAGLNLWDASHAFSVRSIRFQHCVPRWAYHGGCVLV